MTYHQTGTFEEFSLIKLHYWDPKLRLDVFLCGYLQYAHAFEVPSAAFLRFLFCLEWWCMKWDKNVERITCKWFMMWWASVDIELDTLINFGVVFNKENGFCASRTVNTAIIAWLYVSGCQSRRNSIPCILRNRATFPSALWYLCTLKTQRATDEIEKVISLINKLLSLCHLL